MEEMMATKVIRSKKEFDTIIKTGVIGVGYLGRFHAQKYAAIDGVELVGVADIDKSQADTVALECNCSAYEDYLQLLDQVDAVVAGIEFDGHGDAEHDPYGGIIFRIFKSMLNVCMRFPALMRFMRP